MLWTREGSTLFMTALESLTDDQLKAPSVLEGWSRRHVAAHTAANADGLRNLVHWARTGEERPMYASMEARDADIKSGAKLPSHDLRTWVAMASDAIIADLEDLTVEQWEAPVRTRQGTEVKARAIPWMRAREVMIHAVDLDAGISFDALPLGFLGALVNETAAQRSLAADVPAVVLRHGDDEWVIDGSGEPTVLYGSLGTIAAYLVGRAHDGLADAVGNAAPALPAWL